jgi:surface antigen
MRQVGLVLAAAVMIPLLSTGCQNNEQTYGAGGAAFGALACGVAGNAIFHSAFGTVASAATCGAVGYFVGSSIGRELDERDRQAAAAATQQALEEPVYYTATQTTPVHPRPRAVAWNSDHGTGTHGSASVVAVQPRPSGGECRTVREVAYIKGQEVTQQSQYCRNSADGSWTAST